jgi:hypothetical protein
MFTLIILGLIAYGTGKVAQGKGYDFLFWFLIGVITGGLGLLIAFFLPDKRQAV